MSFQKQEGVFIVKESLKKGVIIITKMAEIQCANCGIKTYKIPVRIKKINFCSRSCKTSWQWGADKTLRNKNVKRIKNLTKINTPEEIMQLAEAYKKGFSNKRLCKEFGITHPTLKDRLRRAGITEVKEPRKRGFKYSPLDGGYGYDANKRKSMMLSILILDGCGVGSYMISKKLKIFPLTVRKWREFARFNMKMKLNVCEDCQYTFLYPKPRDKCFACCGATAKFSMLKEYLEFLNVRNIPHFKGYV